MSHARVAEVPGSRQESMGQRPAARLRTRSVLNHTPLLPRDVSGCKISAMKHVFGPAPSRRLGQSLGVDPVPLKTCNWNCVYCQLGRSRPVVNERRDYIPVDSILADVGAALDAHPGGTIDWVTFCGSGETVLHASLGTMVRAVKAMTDLPVAVITNGTLLHLPDVRDAVRAADAVLPTLCAGSRNVYKRIARPHAAVPFESYIAGLIVLSHEYDGAFWPEIMLVRGINDTEKALLDLRRVLRQIKTERVHLNLPERATAEAWVQAPDEEGILRAIAILGDVVEVVHPRAPTFDLSTYDNATDAAIAIIGRHPIREDDLERTLERFGSEDPQEVLRKLVARGRVQVVDRLGVRFYCPVGSFYPDEARSERSRPSGGDPVN